MDNFNTSNEEYEEEYVDLTDVEVVVDGEGPRTSSDITTDESHDSLSEQRTIKLSFKGVVSFVITEPPVVEDAEVQSILYQRLFDAISGYNKYAVISGYSANIEVEQE